MLAALWQGGVIKTINFSLLASPQRTLLISLVVIVAIAGTVIVGYRHTQKYIAAIFYGNALGTFTKTGDLDRTIGSLSNAINLDNMQDRYYRTLSQVLLLKAGEVLRRPGLNQDEIQTQFRDTLQNSITIAKRATKINPVEPLNWNQLASIYENVMPVINGADMPAVDAYTKVTEGDPKNPQALLNIARVLVASADKIQREVNIMAQAQEPDQERIQSFVGEYNNRLEQALHHLDRSIALKSDFTPAYFLAAQIFERQGKRSFAIQKTEQARNLNFRDLGVGFQLAFLYYLDERFDDSRREFKRLVDLNENYSNARYFLGLIYDLQGEKGKAAAEFEKIAKLNPANEEVKTILENLNAGRGALEGVVPSPTERVETPIPETGGAQQETKIREAELP